MGGFEGVRRLLALTLSGSVVSAVLVLAGCAEEAVERPPTPTVAPTAAAAATPSGGQPAAQPTATAAARAPDAALGQKLFTNLACVGCHSTKDVKLVGPGLAGLKDRAGTRVAGLSARAYIEQSIRDPNAYVVEGFPPNIMLTTFGTLSTEDMQDLIAYLETL
jgi:cytochrome c2